MVQDDGFSIISVNSDNDDSEVVVYAGVRSDASEELSSGVGGEPKEEQEHSSPKEAIEALTSSVSEADQVDAVQQNTSTSLPSQDDDYQETTLEDLKVTGPFPKTQLIVVVCALLFMGGFVVYYMITH